MAQASKAQVLRHGRVEDGQDELGDIPVFCCEVPVGSENIGLGAHVDPLPPRHEIERRLQQSVVIEDDSPHDQIGRIAVHGCEHCGANFSFGVSRLTTCTTDVKPLSQAPPQPERLITPQGAAVNQDLEQPLGAGVPKFELEVEHAEAAASSLLGGMAGTAVAPARVSRDLELAWAALDERLLRFEQLLRGRNDGNTRDQLGTLHQ